MIRKVNDLIYFRFITILTARCVCVCVCVSVVLKRNIHTRININVSIALFRERRRSTPSENIKQSTHWRSYSSLTIYMYAIVFTTCTGSPDNGVPHKGLRGIMVV